MTTPPGTHPASPAREQSRAGGRLRTLGALVTNWSALPVRTRVVALLVFLTAVALLLSGATAYALQRSGMARQVDDSLTRSVQEFRILAQEGIDPATGEPFSASDQLVFTAMQRTLPAQHEGMLGFQDGEISWTASSAVELRLESDPELVRWAADQLGSDQVAIQTITTAQTTYRAVAVPIHFDNDSAPSLMLLAYDFSAELGDLDSTFLTYGLVGFGVMIVVGVAGWLLVGRLLHPLRILQSTAAEISGTDLRRRVPVSGQDDVAELAETFNEMLDRLQGAFSSQRQLLDDVGHELRTPITIVQGHLELQDAEDAADVREVREIALDELDRMRLLVDDLVTLAKSGRPDFVDTEPTDVGTLTRDVLGKASPLGPRIWTLDHAADVTVSLDAQRITQAWLQLASNAVKYSEEGSKVSLGSQALSGTLRLWVRDQGIGIRPEDREGIFERFGRGSNSTRAEGSGLGLNIVTAIVQAHGGSVDVQSAPGIGSTFYIDLPLDGPVDGLLDGLPDVTELDGADGGHLRQVGSPVSKTSHPKDGAA
ncbi:cell wall metabolism sensor histidine kinase WalK [Citricoccus sp. K5]|uniref:sensor histidine kinase n=1 Tax=Citricoccus sp. K5 TaxID=2653135 RepID=UPI0012F41962|nr:HAMP domain-containing sensor histidine kinase [Citricoccus sp. K5]VXB60350.1 Signal transduction histidine kinase [Citricoccus sp. K5]